MQINRHRILTILLITACSLAASSAFAMSIAGVPMVSAGPMPWERVLGAVASSLTGPTAKLMALLGIIICGYLWVTAEGEGMRRLLKVGIGISLLVGGGNIVNYFWQGGTGALI